MTHQQHLEQLVLLSHVAHGDSLRELQSHVHVGLQLLAHLLVLLMQLHVLLKFADLIVLQLQQILRQKLLSEDPQDELDLDLLELGVIQIVKLRRSNLLHQIHVVNSPL